MPFVRKTLSQLIQEAFADIDAGLPAGQGRLRFSLPGLLAKAMAGMMNGGYGYLDWIARQAVPFTSTGEYLEAWGALKNIAPKAATAASGSVRFPAAAGAVLLVGTVVVNAANVTYVTTAEAAEAGGYITAPVTAAVAGASGNCGAGTIFSLGSAVAGVSVAGAAYTDITGGDGQQSSDSYRADVLAAYARILGGGTVDDYEVWARQVAGVTRAWAQRAGMGPGSVVVRVMLDIANSGGGGFPIGDDGVATAELTGPDRATGDQLRVANHIFGLQPCDATVYVTAAIANTVTYNISGLIAAPGSVHTAVTAALAALFYEQGRPGGTIDLSAQEAAITAVPGTPGFVITAMACSHGAVSPAGVGNIQCNAGAIPIVGAITWS